MPVLRLTKRVIEALEPTDQIQFFWHEELPSFGVRVSPGGTKAFVVQFRDGAKTVRKTIGKHPSMALDRARGVAADVLAAQRLGEELPLKREGGILFGEVLDEFISKAKALRAPRTAADYETRINKYIRPAFGKKRIRHITRLDVERFLQEFSDRPAQGNHVVTILVAALSYAAKTMKAIAPHEHPALGLEKYGENQRDRHLTIAEIERFGVALAGLEAKRRVSPWAAAALRLLLLTGARSGEILDLTWGQVNFERELLDLPTSKTGAKRIKLNAHALQVLRDVPRVQGCEFVIAGRRHGEAMTSLQRPFGLVLAVAKIENLRIHDLRHTAASIATSGGVGLPVVGAMLGQSQAYTTQRYSHIHDEAERLGAGVVGDRVGPYLNVVPMVRK